MSCLNDERLGDVVDGVADAEAIGHVADCAVCAERVAGMRALGDALRALPLARESAPAALGATLRGLDAGVKSERRRRLRALPGFLAAAAAAAVLVLSPGADGITEALADEAVSHHLRAFAKGEACEVESADAAALASWLGIALGESVEVPVRPGVELVGARRCSLFGEQAGAVVYRAGATAVTMFVPAPGSSAERACARAVGECRTARDGQTVCVVGTQERPRVLVGELPGEQLCAVAGNT